MKITRKLTALLLAAVLSVSALSLGALSLSATEPAPSTASTASTPGATTAPATYTIKFTNPKSDTNPVYTLTATVGVTVTVPAITLPEYPDFSFTGWRNLTVSEDTTIYAPGSSFVYRGGEDVVMMHADFSAVIWNVIFTPGDVGAVGTTPTIRVVGGQTLIFPTCGYTTTNYEFTGWTIGGTGTLPEGSASANVWAQPSDRLYSPDQPLTNVNSNILVTANWKLKAGVKWKLTLNPGEGDGSPLTYETTFENGTKFKISDIANPFVTPGWRFTGWIVNEKFYPAGSIDEIEIKSNLVLTAKWVADTSSATSSVVSSAPSSQTSSVTSSKTSSATSSKTSSATSSKTSSKTSSAVSSKTSSVASSAPTSVKTLTNAAYGIVLTGDFTSDTQLNALPITAGTVSDASVRALLSNTSVQQLRAYEITLSNGSIVTAGKITIPLNLPALAADTAIVLYHFITPAEYELLGELPNSPVFTKQTDGSYGAMTGDGVMACPFTLDGFVITEVSDAVSANMLRGAFQLDDGNYALYFIQKYSAGSAVDAATVDYMTLSPFAVTAAKLSIPEPEPTETKSDLPVIIGICVAVVAALVIIGVLMISRRNARSGRED